MTLNEAIEKAVAEGYDLSRGEMVFRGLVIDSQEKVLLDPLFWQSLGEAMGWKEDKMYQFDSMHATGMLMHEWLWYWHRFIDHLADGKSIESFFEQLT